jgi:hypothetical protein
VRDFEQLGDVCEKRVSSWRVSEVSHFRNFLGDKKIVRERE